MLTEVLVMESAKKSEHIEETNKDLESIPLPNYRTLYISEKGEVYYLTPFERIDPENYAQGHLNDYQNAIIQYESGIDYDDDGKTFSVLDTSIAEKKGNAVDNFSVDIWLHSCYLVIIKSEDTGRYWLLHYDPLQTTNSTNIAKIPDINFVKNYHRPNYCDLNPAIPYEEPSISLQEGEKVKAIVLHVTNDYKHDNQNNMMEGAFDLYVFCERLKGHLDEDSVIIKSLRQKNDKDNGDQPDFDITFKPQGDQLEVVRRHDKKIIIDEKKCFDSFAHEAISLPKLKDNTFNKITKSSLAKASENMLFIELDMLNNLIKNYIKANDSPKTLFKPYDDKKKALKEFIEFINEERAVGKNVGKLIDIWLNSDIEVNGQTRQIKDILHEYRFFPVKITSTEKFIEYLKGTYGDHTLANTTPENKLFKS